MKIKLKDIASFSKGQQINGDNLLPLGNYSYLNGGILPSGYWNEYNVPANSIAISEGGNSCGYVNYMCEPFWCGAHCYYFYNIKIPNTKYLYYALKAHQDDIMRLRSGACMPNIKKSDLGEFEFECDLDINNQERVVNQLDKLERTICLRKQQLLKLDEVVKSRFVEMFGEVETNVKGFAMKRMDECCKFIGGAQPDKSHFEYEKTDDNIRLIQIRDYKSDRFITYIPKSLARKTCAASDIMIGRYGPPIFQILGGIEGAYNVALMKAVPTVEFNTEYFRYFLKSEKLLHYLESFSQRTAGQDGIQIDKLNAYPCLVPPIELQEQFAFFVEQVDKSKFEIQKSLEKLETLKKALMQKYFG